MARYLGRVTKSKYRAPPASPAPNQCGTSIAHKHIALHMREPPARKWLFACVPFFVHGLLQCVVDSFAGRRLRQQLQLFYFVDKQQRAHRGFAGAIMFADRTVYVKFVAGCSGSVADPFGCVRGSQLWRQSCPPENAKVEGCRGPTARSIGFWQ